jgi:hypothetical protein
MTRKGQTISIEAASNQTDTLIERRAREAQDANGAAEAWAQSVRSYNVAAQTERREQWRCYHDDMHRIHARIAEEHLAKAERLAGEAEGGRGQGL